MSELSGRYWIGWANIHAKNSESIDDLDGTFKSNVQAFVSALEAAGVRVKPKSTKRSEKRAYLFHWAWKIALGRCKASDATATAGVDIQWDHGDVAKSKRGAQEMVDGFGLAVPPKSTVAPGLSSNHIRGLAIDLEILWGGEVTIKNRAGTDVKVTYMANTNLNTALIEVGRSYGVMKHVTDEPHWSHNGR